MAIGRLTFKEFPCEEYYSKYQDLEVTRHTPLMDKIRLIFFELPKLPKEITADNGLELWISLFRAKTQEELDTLERMEVPDVREAIQAYKDITVSPEFLRPSGCAPKPATMRHRPFPTPSAEGGKM